MRFARTEQLKSLTNVESVVIGGSNTKAGLLGRMFL